MARVGIVATLIFLAPRAAAQGEEAQSLLAVPIEGRKALVAGDLKALISRIDAGIREAQTQADEGFRRKLQDVLNQQKTAAGPLLVEREKAPETTESWRARLEEARRAREVPPKMPIIDRDDLERVRGHLQAVQPRLNALQEELTVAEAEAQAVASDRSDGSDLISRKEAEVAKIRTDVEQGLAEVTALEADSAEPARLWVKRETTFTDVLRLATAERQLELLRTRLGPAVLDARKAVADARLERRRQDVQELRVRADALTERVKVLEERARQDRDVRRARLTRSAEAAPPYERPIFDLQINQIDSEADAAATLEAVKGWESRFVTGKIGEDRDQVRELVATLDEEFLSEGDSELGTFEGAQARLARLEAAQQEVQRDWSQARRALREAKALSGRLDQRAKEDLEAMKTAATEAGISEVVWQSLERRLTESKEAYRTALNESIVANEKLSKSAESREAELQESISSLRKTLPRLQSVLLWQREDSPLEFGSISRAINDVGQLPLAVQRFGVAASARGGIALAPEHRTRLWFTGILAVFLSGLLFFVHRRLPRTFSWLETRKGEGSGLLRVIAAGIRRSEFALMLGLSFAGVCGVWWVAPWRVPILSVLCLAPFFYRFLRVVVDVLFHPNDVDERLVDVENDLAATLHRTCRWLLNLSLIFVALGLLMEQGGYRAHNPEFLRVWWFTYTFGFFAVLLAGLGRPSVVSRFIRGQGQVANSLKTLALVVQPLVVVAILFLVTLHSLRYRTASEFFQGKLAATIGIIAGAYLVYRWLLRRILPEREFLGVAAREDFEDDASYAADGRRRTLDLLSRALLRIGVFIPTSIWLAGVWEQMSWSFFNAPITGWEGGLTWRRFGWGVAAIWITSVFLAHYRRWMRFVLLPKTGLEVGLGYAILTLSSYFIGGVGAVIALNLLQVQGDQIAYVLSALMVGIGFGLKDIVTNFISGIMLLVERPLKVGDQIDIGNDSGIVEKINMRSTTIMTFDNVGVVVPNADLITGRLINRSAGSPLLRTRVDITAGYDSDVRQVMSIIRQCVDDHGLVLRRPPASIWFTNFGNDALEFRLNFWTRVKDNRMQIAGDLRAAILAKFRAQGVEIPFPQRDLHLRSIEPEVLAVLRGEATPNGRDPMGPPAPPAPEAPRGGTGPSEEMAQRMAADAEPQAPKTKT